MNITKIKNMLEENSSKNVRFKFNGNRNQIEEFDGRIINTYKYLFVVKPNDTGIKSLVCGTIGKLT